MLKRNNNGWVFYLLRVVKVVFIWTLIIYLFVGLNDFLPQAQAGESRGPEIEGQGALLLERNSGKILYAKNEKEKLYPASTTKILTALVVLENCQLDEVITVGEEINFLSHDGSSAGLAIGDQLKVLDLLNGLMLPSGNDAANVLAVYVARKVGQDREMEIETALKFFAGLMNKRAAKAGASNSLFTNPHGLHDENHYTTPLDLGKIALEAMENPTFRQLVQTEEYELESLNVINEPSQENPRIWENTNKLLDRDSTYYMDEVTGIKTGFTTPAGYCLVSSASAKGLELIGVVLKTSSTGRWTDSRKLLNYGLEEFKYVPLLKAGEEVTKVAIANPSRKDTGELSVLATHDFTDLIHYSQIPEVEKHIIWNEELLAENIGNILRAPLKKGQELGKVYLTLGGVVLTESTIVAGRDVKSASLFENFFSGYFPLQWLFGSMLCIMLIGIVKSRKKVRKRTI